MTQVWTTQEVSHHIHENMSNTYSLCVVVAALYAKLYGKLPVGIGLSRRTRPDAGDGQGGIQMSCELCDQETGERIAYYRWKTANVGMIGCPQHLREIFDALSKAQAAVQEITKDVGERS